MPLNFLLPSLITLGVSRAGKMFGGGAGANFGQSNTVSSSHQDPDYKRRILGLYDTMKMQGPRPTYNKSVFPELNPMMKSSLMQAANSDFGVGNIYDTINAKNPTGAFGRNILGMGQEALKGLGNFQHYSSPFNSDSPAVSGFTPVTGNKEVVDPFKGKTKTDFDDFNSWLDKHIAEDPKVANAKPNPWDVPGMAELLFQKNPPTDPDAPGGIPDDTIDPNKLPPPDPKYGGNVDNSDPANPRWIGDIPDIGTIGDNLDNPIYRQYAKFLGDNHLAHSAAPDQLPALTESELAWLHTWNKLIHGRAAGTDTTQQPPPNNNDPSQVPVPIPGVKKRPIWRGDPGFYKTFGR